MFDNMTTAFHKQATRIADFNQKALKWQLDQAEQLTRHFRAQSDAAVQISIDSAKIAVDSMLDAQRAVLDAMVPAQAD